MRGKFDGGDFGYDGRVTSGIVVLDPATGEIKKRKEMPYGNSPARSRPAGGIIVTALLDGTVVALDDQTLEELWSFNVGTGINAPPMTYAVDGKQYIAIATGLTRNQIGRLANSPETQDDVEERDHDLRVRAVNNEKPVREGDDNEDKQRASWALLVGASAWRARHRLRAGRRDLSSACSIPSRRTG